MSSIPMASSRCNMAIWVMVVVAMSMMGRSHGQTRGPLAASFNSWGKNVRYDADGRGVQLVLDALSAAGMGSKASYLFGGFGAWMKLPPNDSAGTVTTLYMSSPGPRHCEFDFEFLGNQTGQPFLLHTNIFVDGVGGREQQIDLGFDPSADFHYYNFQWNRDMLVFYVDNTPIRMFQNLRAVVPAFPYPDRQPMALFLSIWDGSSWATQGGRVPIAWAAAPFVASYRNFRLRGCVVNPTDRHGVRACQASAFAMPGTSAQSLGMARIRQMRAVRASQVKYNYCDDRKRYPVAPIECSYNVL